jgi:catechol 2,3-dioxygenase-like lactoylglutathione lyase family enzyme
VRIQLTSVYVTDQTKALAFYTDTLGFVKNLDIPMGKYRWLTVVSPEDPKGVNLVLEPNTNPAAAQYQKALHDQGGVAANFFVNDLEREVARLKEKGVRFTQGPKKVIGSMIAILEDGCGNLVQITQLDHPMG